MHVVLSIKYKGKKVYKLMRYQKQKLTPRRSTFILYKLIYLLTRSVSFLFITSSASATIITTIVSSASAITTSATLLKFSSSWFSVTTSIPVTHILLWTVCFYKWSIRKRELAISDAGQFTLDGVVMNYFFMPVVVGKLHIIGHCICKTKSLIRVFFFQCFIDNHFKVFTQM